MAEKAKDDARKSNVTDETIVDFVEALDTLNEVAELKASEARKAKKDIKDCRNRAKAAGINLTVLDEKLAEKLLSDDERREKLAQGDRYERVLNMTPTLDLSKAYQAELEFSQPDAATIERMAKRDAMQAGIEAGRAGHPREMNRFDNGTLPWQAFDTGWIHGNETRVALDEAQVLAPKPRRGRPRKANAAEAETGATLQ